MPSQTMFPLVRATAAIGKSSRDQGQIVNPNWQRGDVAGEHPARRAPKVVSAQGASAIRRGLFGLNRSCVHSFLRGRILEHIWGHVLCQNRPESGSDKHQHKNHMEHPIIDESLMQRVEGIEGGYIPAVRPDEPPIPWGSPVCARRQSSASG